MSFFTNLRADRLIVQIKSTTDLMGRETQKAIGKLKDIGPGAIEPVIAALPEADKHATVAFVDVLATLVTAKTFPQYVQALVQGSPRVDRRRRLGTHQQSRLPAAPAARSALDPGHRQIGAARRHQWPARSVSPCASC